MSEALAIRDLPQPHELAVAQVPRLVELVKAVRTELRETSDIAGADELRRRLAAYERYVVDKGAKRSIEAESRRTEVLIGELLGPAENHGPATSQRLTGLHTQERVWFRELHAYAPTVENRIAAGVTARAQILTAIEREKFAVRGAGVKSSTHVGDFRKVLSHIPDDSVDLIFTDPPYNKEAIGLYGDLAEFGARVLKPGGSLMAYCGQYALPQILVDMDGYLRYWWMCACVHQGGNHKSLPGIKTYVLWKPIVWFVKETNAATDFVFDAILRPAPDKTSHDWAQAQEEPRHYIEKLTPVNGIVVDPFAGGGTTQLVAESLGRRFIGAELSAEQERIATGRQAA